MMDTQLGLTLFVLTMSQLCILGGGIQCYDCSASQFGVMPNCNTTGTNKTCYDKEDRCLVMKTSMIKNNVKTYQFQRSCGNKEGCASDFCKNMMIKVLKKATCHIKCCAEDLCNTDDVSNPTSAAVRDSATWWSLNWVVFLLQFFNE